MCCDWFDMLMGFTCGFILGCIVIGTLTKKFMVEQADQRTNLHARTQLKDNQCL